MNANQECTHRYAPSSGAAAFTPAAALSTGVSIESRVPGACRKHIEGAGGIEMEESCVS
jgi:hypothetical protein